MKAQVLADSLDEALIGETVFTHPMGQYPGGYAKVTAILPDPGAPEIAFQVEPPKSGEIGIYGYEEVGLVVRTD